MNIYFAVDKLASDFIKNLSDALQSATSKNCNLSLYALIDAAFEYTKDSSKQSTWKSQAASLYKGTAHDRLTEASPYLLRLFDDPSEMRLQLRRILQTSSGIPMISFIASTLPIKELIATFKPFLEIRVDAQCFLLRFSDTRILPVLDSILCNENIAGWRQEIMHWWFPDRTGNLASLPEHENNKQPFDPEKDSLSVSQGSFNLLIDAGESDAILGVISDQNSDLLKDKLPSEAYALVQRLRGKIAEFHIDNFPDIVMFCTTALATSECFHASQEFNKVLKSGAWTHGKLGDALSAIDDASWREIESMNPPEVKQQFLQSEIR
jgi:hypothetical protein